MTFNILIEPSGAGRGTIKIANLSYELAQSFLISQVPDYIPFEAVDVLKDACNRDVTLHGLWLNITIRKVDRETKTYHFGQSA